MLRITSDNVPYGTATYRSLLIEPFADRSIAIRHIARWENGRPMLDDSASEELRARRAILLKLLRVRASTDADGRCQ